MLLPASTWIDAALIVTPAPCQLPFTCDVVFAPCRTIFELPVTVIAPVTLRVDPPPTLKFPAPETVIALAVRLVPLPNVSEPWLSIVMLVNVRFELGGSARLSETVRFTLAPRR